MRKLLSMLAGLAIAGSLFIPASASAVPGPALVASVHHSDFWIVCPFNGISRTIDPIVSPGSVNTPYYNDFYASTQVTENSTPVQLQAAGEGSTSCTTGYDTASYWAPQLLLGPGETQTYGPPGSPCVNVAGGLACHYAYIRAYYSTGGSAQLSNMPFGMETVGGDAAATAPQPIEHVTWSCGRLTPFEQYPYDCRPYIDLPTGRDGVIERIIMPNCWNGMNPADSANFTYPPCAAGSFVLPLLNVRFHTGIVTPCPGQSCPPGSKVAPDFGFRSATDSMLPWYAVQGGFMNGWQYSESGLSDLVQDCLITGIACPPNPHTTPRNNMPT